MKVSEPPKGLSDHTWESLYNAGWDGFVLGRESRVTYYGGDALDKLIKDYDFDTILDIGCGSGTATKHLRSHNKKVTALDSRPEIMGFTPDVVGDYMESAFERPFNAIWCSHVLEHVPNPNIFLRRIFDDLALNGVLGITVPPLKHDIVQGHVSLWNAGLLLYHLVIAGFDCRHAAVRTYGYNVSVIIRKKPHDVTWTTDFQHVAKFFPVAAQKTFDGRIKSLNW